jgi:hypothetical protein
VLGYAYKQLLVTKKLSAVAAVSAAVFGVVLKGNSDKLVMAIG